MKKTFKFEDRETTIVDVSAIFDGERTTGVLVHDSTDVNCEGDCIFFDVATSDIDTIEDLQALFDNEWSTSDWEVLQTVGKLNTTVRDARRAAGMTQQQLAEKIGKNYRWIQKLESGEAKLENTTVKNALLLAGALNVDLKDLI